MKLTKKLRFRPISIAAIGRYEYEVNFQQPDHVVSFIFNVLDESPVAQHSDEFWVAMGGDSAPKSLYQCVLELDAARILRCKFKDVAIFGHEPSGCFRENRIMPVEPLSISATGAYSYSVQFNDKLRSAFEFAVDADEKASVRYDKKFETFMNDSLDDSRSLLSAIHYFHKARTDEDFAE